MQSQFLKRYGSAAMRSGFIFAAKSEMIHTAAGSRPSVETMLTGLFLKALYREIEKRRFLRAAAMGSKPAVPSHSESPLPR